ncbi:MAG: transposase [Deltaproteobacteria bacterium]|nr:transposase [Deltaproteobacteria bacterium]
MSEAHYRLKRPGFDGKQHITLSPEAFIRRLAALIPPPWFNLTRFHGIFAGHSKHRQLLKALVPKPPDPQPTCGLPRDDHDVVVDDEPELVPIHRRIVWSELLRRTFGFDVLACPRCDGRMRLIAPDQGPRRRRQNLASHRPVDRGPRGGAGAGSAPARLPRRFHQLATSPTNRLCDGRAAARSVPRSSLTKSFAASAASGAHTLFKTVQLSFSLCTASKCGVKVLGLFQTRWRDDVSPWRAADDSWTCCFSASSPETAARSALDVSHWQRQA